MRRPSLANERGEIAIAVLLSVLALISGLSMSMIAGRDATAALQQLDQVQELSLVRSDIRRGIEVTRNVSSTIDNFTLPIRYIDVDNGVARTTYAIKTKIRRVSQMNGSQLTQNRGISTLVRAFRTLPTNTNFDGRRNRSPIETFGQKAIRKQTFAGYMYLTNTEESINSDEVRFYGYDELWGRVHSNTDIHIQMYGGSWPTFHGHVSTGGSIQPPSGWSADQVFLDGYTEHAGIIDFNGSMALILQHGQRLYANADIASIELQRDGYTAWLADVNNLPVDTLVVYNLYPPYGDVGDSIGVNLIALRDTNWTVTSGNIPANGTMLVESGEMWIQGKCKGAMTWASLGDMMLSGDIKYDLTQEGHLPDGSGGEPVNVQDYLGLVSAKSIYVQYGYENPNPEVVERFHNNCGPTYEKGIYIYAALAALGDGEGDPHEDGNFTFEYYFPHASTPNTWYNGEYFDNVDMHLGYFPDVMNGDQDWPWPAMGGGGYNYADLPGASGPDLPYYNPLWPELVPFLERGHIHLYGSVAQVRRGFVHRSGRLDADNGYWDLDDHMYGPVPVFGVNVLNTPGDKDGIGYDKDYHYDHRFITNPPPNFPEVSIAGSQGEFEGVAMRFNPPPRSF